eukprot:gnl/TRDRNA2_/TRDRNA2_186883_c0_seq1.p1 gnl/TRDRNA2_/TRDRNA2_186883_c0~~gnl/TRDRNA2_/TRDRNA2_186883_c0_seq1.p1  ORF type:complete len:152 (-),score=32.45 gnl/TRDRNA2_/TRDRNA2_186883_c0_seq1:97-552(-)
MPKRKKGGEFTLWHAFTRLSISFLSMGVVMGLRFLAKTEEGPEKSAMLLGIFSVGAGCNAGGWLMDKKGVPLAQIVLVTYAVVASALLAAKQVTPLQDLGHYLHRNSTLEHVAFLISGLVVGISVAAFIAESPSGDTSAAAEKDESSRKDK